MRFRRGMIIAIWIACMSWILGACTIEGKIDSAKSPSSQTTQSTQVHEDQLELLEYDLEYELGTVTGYKTITGIVVNGTKHNLTLVDITFALYNVDDFKLGEALASNSGLESGEKWKFETGVLGAAVRVEPVQLKGYR